MARRRYISTQISIDKDVNRLAMEYGDFAALLYTWMIPHAEDDCSLTGDPEELLWKVAPGRRDKTAEDVVKALEGMADLGLILWDREDRRIEFPSAAFYRFQTYIPKNKQVEENSIDIDDAGKERVTPKNAEDRRKAAQNAASPSPSLSPSPKDLKPLPDEGTSGRCEKSEEAPEPETADSKPYERFIRDKFDAFWEKYPRRVAKKDALKAFRGIFNRRLSKSKGKVLLENFSLHYRYFLEVQLPNIRDPGYIPYPASWLRSTDFGSPPEAEFNSGVGTADSKANSAWETVKQATQHKMTVGSIEDRAIHAVIESMGGWQRLEWMPMSSLEGEKENFIRQYRLECTRTKEAVGNGRI